MQIASRTNFSVKNYIFCTYIQLMAKILFLDLIFNMSFQMQTV